MNKVIYMKQVEEYLACAKHSMKDFSLLFMDFHTLISCYMYKLDMDLQIIVEGYDLPNKCTSKERRNSFFIFISLCCYCDD